MRIAEVHLILTVGARNDSFRLVARQPKSLKPNEVAYKVVVRVDTEEWKNRVISVDLGQAKPPKRATLDIQAPLFGKDLPTAVVDRLVEDE
jgi:hypothetical protein